MPLPPPAAPSHLLRLHSHSINSLAFSDDNERLYSGDSSGLVVVTSTRTLRLITKWQAHSDGLLGIEEWGDEVVTHGRDNNLHVWKCIIDVPESARLGDAAARLDTPAPQLSYSLNVNALNYCRFSLLCLKSNDPEGKNALIAVPGLIDSSVADVWTLPSRDRVHAAIGQEIPKSVFSTDPKGRNSAGIIMSLHLYSLPSESSEIHPQALHLLCAYEDGSVTLRKYTRTDKSISTEGTGWAILWTTKLHAETIMAMKVSRQQDFAISVSADHLVCRYDLKTATADSVNPGIAYRSKHPGNSSIAIREDGKVCAIGGWDGSIRLYSTRTLKPLGTLKYHKTTCQALEFARTSTNTNHPMSHGDTDSDDEMTLEEKAERSRWLVGGGKDCRVSIWSLITFSRTKDEME